MSVTNITEQFGSGSGSISNKGESSYSRTFLVHCSSAYDRPSTCFYSLSLLGVTHGSPYPDDSTAVCNGLSAQYIQKSQYIWAITANYGPPTQEEDNPIKERVKYSYNFAQFKELIDEDIFDTPILNSAGDPYEDAIERDDSRSVMTVKINLSANVFSWATANLYRDKVNAQSWKGAKPGTVKMAGITAEDNWHQKCGYYYSTSWTFHHNPLTWDKKLLQKGFNERVKNKDGDYIKKKILINGKEPTDAVLLDKKGARLEQDAQPVFKDHKIYYRVPFASFPF